MEVPEATTFNSLTARGGGGGSGNNQPFQNNSPQHGPGIGNGGGGAGRGPSTGKSGNFKSFPASPTPTVTY